MHLQGRPDSVGSPTHAATAQHQRQHNNYHHQEQVPQHQAHTRHDTQQDQQQHHYAHQKMQQPPQNGQQLSYPRQQDEHDHEQQQRQLYQQQLQQQQQQFQQQLQNQQLQQQHFQQQPFQQAQQHSFLSNAGFQQPQRGYVSNYGLRMAAGGGSNSKQQSMPSYGTAYSPPMGSGYLPSPVPQSVVNNEKPLEMYRGLQQLPVFHSAQSQPSSALDSEGAWKKRSYMDYSESHPALSKESAFNKERSNGSHTKKNGNEAILRELALKNKSKSPLECAMTVREAELAVLNMDPSTHTKAEIQAAEQVRERERQVYALTWLMDSCVEEKNSFVPRGRIFAQYAACCAQNNLKPLSQATLGKLIRSIFPDLTTRRLGMRGQSKYHYCGLNLISPSRSTSPNPSFRNFEAGNNDDANPVNEIPNNRHEPHNHQLPDNAQDRDKNASLYPSISSTSLPASNSTTPLIFQDNYQRSEGQAKDTARWKSLKVAEELFVNTSNVDINVSLEIPSITPHLPPNTDKDIASSLECMYKVHCNTVQENFSFAKFDALTNTLESFSSTSISPQMFNLFISEFVYDWVNQADWVTHKASIKSLAKFIKEFATIPSSVSDKLINLSRTYSDVISNANIDLPVPMVKNKVMVAEKFSKLVKRSTRVIRTAKSASKAYKTKSSREDMYQDWKKFIDSSEICRTELFCCSEDETSLKEISNFILQTIDNFFNRDEHSISDNFPIDLAVQVLSFLVKIHDQPASIIIANVNVFTTGVIRELSIMGSENAGSWWAIKTFIDEWLRWCDEIGTFMMSSN
ncbi:LADA_0H15786g1_1 [Lachancea dasiensis]|uniref:LADA_0H15786g1_1 n=1 Tax=Lachancea dasiensis TaxID=1072105 RepID=A0A1G4K574_9SACH|nr:LADA_0H15786g1_1 [Lachancea dasiensis]